MSTRTWHKGPPPHIGWWNASKLRDEKAWRFHNGDDWSYAAEPEDSMQEVRRSAGLLDYYGTNDIEWTDYWPENARVPRIDPRSKT